MPAATKETPRAANPKKKRVDPEAQPSESTAMGGKIESPATPSSNKLSVRVPYLVSYLDSTKLFCQMLTAGDTGLEHPKKVERGYDLFGEDDYIHFSVVQVAIYKRMNCIK